MMVQSSSKRRLLVEGRDDKYSIINLLSQHGGDWDTPDSRLPYIEICDGFENLRQKVSKALFKTLDVVGIVIDADLDPQGRWQSICAKLGESAIQPPDKPVLGGWVSPSSNCGIWLMPDNQYPGMLEDFLKTLVPVNDKCWSHAETSTDTAKALGAPFTEVAKPKARIHTWLAWQEEPGQPFGQAITARVLQATAPTAQEFVNWFNRLFA